MDTGRHIARREQGPEHLEKMEERVPGTGPPKPAHSLPAVPRGFRYLADSFVGNRLLAILFLVTSPCSAGKRDSGHNDKEPDDIVAAH